MIYDCFLYNGEIDCLKIRIEEAAGLDVKHILVESNITFTGKQKLSYFTEKDYKEFNSKNIIVHNVVYPHISSNPWDNEFFLRNQIKSILQTEEVVSEDIVILSDVDEIVKRTVLECYSTEQGCCSLVMDHFNYYLNLLCGKQNWPVAKIFPYKYFIGKTPEQIRNNGHDNVIQNAGWHFSWMGGIDKILEKFSSFSHQEEAVQKHNNKSLILQKLQTGQSLFGDDYWEFVKIDDSFPIDVKINLQKYKHCIFNADTL